MTTNKVFITACRFRYQVTGPLRPSVTNYLQTENPFSAISVSKPGMSGNHLERCLPAGQRSAPNETILSTCIIDLPSEILTEIIKQILPEDIPRTYDADEEYHPTFGKSFRLGFAHSRPRPGEHTIEYRFAVLYTNRRLYAETLCVLQARIKKGQSRRVKENTRMSVSLDNT